MARIGIIGLGNWGTALAKVWCDDGHNVMGWTIEPEVYESIMTENICLLYTSPSPRDGLLSRMPSSA